MTASFVESIFQFGIGFKGADKLLRLGKATTATGQATQAIAKGSVGDFIAFDEDTGRFADVVTEYFPSVGDIG